MNNTYRSPAFPVHGSSGSVEIPTNIPTQQTQGMNRPAWGPQPAQQVYQQQDPLMLAMALLDTPVMNSPTGRQTGWSWETAEQKPVIDTSGVDEFLGGSGDEALKAVQALAKQTAAKVIIEIVRDVDNNIASGKMGSLLHAMELFKIDRSTNIGLVPCCEFVNFVNNHPGLRKQIGRSGAICLAGWLVDTMTQNQPLNGKIIENQLVNTFGNVLILEMANWLSSTESGKPYLQAVKSNPYLMGMFSYIPRIEDQFAKYHVMFDKTSPYDGVSIDPKVVYDPKADPTRYASGAVMGEGAQTLEEKELWEMIMRNASMHRQPEKRYTQEHEWAIPETVSLMSTPVGLRDDYKNITNQNRKEFNLEPIFHRINDTDWYVVDSSLWQTVKHAWTQRPDQRFVCSGWDPAAHVVKIDFEKDNGWFEDFVPLKGRKMERIFADPAILLPDLIENRYGEIEVRQIDREDLKREKDGSEWYIPLHDVVELRNKPVALTRAEPVTVSSPEVAEQISETFFEKHKRADNREIFATAVAIKAVTPVITENEHVAESVYKNLDMLTKGSSTRYNNFFKFCNMVYSTMRQERYDENIYRQVDHHLTQEFKRWMVECRGYGATPNDPWHLGFDSLSKDLVDLESWFPVNDKATNAALTNQCPELTRLIEKCQCILPEEDAMEYFAKSSPDDDVAEINDRTILFNRNLVLSRIGNMTPPTKDPLMNTVRVKRSQIPEIFALVESIYGPTSKHMAGSEILFTFEDNDETLWSFVTTDFDRRNVATLRRVRRTRSLVNLGI